MGLGAGQGTVTCPPGVEALHGCWLPPLLQTSQISAHFRNPLTAQPPSLQPRRTSRTETGRKKSLLLLCNAPAAQPRTARQEGNVFKNQANTKVRCQNVALHLGLPSFGQTWPNYATVAAPVHISSSSHYTELLRGFSS